MLCNSLPYNENDDVRITKQSCYDYTLENKSTCSQTVTVTRLTNGSTSYSEVFTLPPLGSYSITLPGDGMYSLTGVNPDCMILSVTDTQEMVFDVMQVSVLYLGEDDNSPITRIRDNVQGINAYDAGTDGASTPSSPTNMLNALDAYGTATGKPYWVQLYTAGNGLAQFAPLYSDTTGYRLVVGFCGTKIDIATVNASDDTPLAHSASYYQSGLPVGYDFVTDALVGGNDIVNTSPAWYDITVPSELIALRDATDSALSVYGTPFLPGILEFTAVILPSASFPTMQWTLAQGEVVAHPIRWCTTLFEWCKLWNCVQQKMAQWLCCTDPCDTTCSNPPHGADWLDMMMSLTVWGMAPLLTEHRIWQFSNMEDDGGSNLARLQPTINLWDRWYKMVQGCGCATTTPCGNCAGGGTLIPQSPIVNPPTANNNGGCGCGC